MAKKKQEPTKKDESSSDKRKSRKSPPRSKAPAKAPVQKEPATVEDRLDKSLDAAQRIVDRAWDTDLPERQAALARKALAISPDCADAYVVLANVASTADEARRLYEQGVVAGRRAIGDELFARSVGHFWGVMKARPYLRARVGLAQCLWEAGECQLAIEHYRDLLRLTPNDNQGIRYLLLAALLDMDADAEVQILLAQYEGDSSAEWAYTLALLAYRQQGDSPESRGLLLHAEETNRFVPAYLVGAKQLPADPPPYISVGDENEAASYTIQFLKNWRGTVGAIPWLRKALKVSLPQPPKVRKPAWSLFQHTFLRLPQTAGEVWQVEVRRLPIDLDETKSLRPPWVLVIWNRTSDTILTFEAQETQPSTADVWESLVEALLRPRSDDPHRPECIEVRRKTFAKAWTEKLRQIGIQCSQCDELEGFDEMLSTLVPASDSIRRFLEGPDASAEASEAEVAELPQSIGEIWQADIRRLPGWLEHDGELRRPWAVLVTNCDDQLVLIQGLSVEPPAQNWFWQHVVEAMRRPLLGDPHRPGIIQVGCDENRDALQGPLESLGVNCVVAEQLEQIDTIFQELGRHLGGGKGAPPVTAVPGVQLAAVGSFYEAAASFYRQSPWRRVAGNFTMKIECDKFQTHTWYGVIMGQTGLVLGLALYEDPLILKAMLSGASCDEEIAHQTSGLSLMYGEAFEIPIADLDAAEKYGWPVAGPEAYPNPVYVNPGRSMRPPLAWELELMEGCLRAISQFLARRHTPQTITVAAGLGELTLRIESIDPQDL